MNAEHNGLIAWLNSTFASLRWRMPDASLTTAVALLVMLTGVALAQTQNADATPTATAHIPYEFWIGGTRLSAGDYTISRVMDTVVLFRNVQTKAEAQAFMMPTETRNVPVNDEKVVFIVRDGQHFLREVWNSDGRQVMSSESGLPLEAADANSQVPLIDQTKAQQVTPDQP
jgi:hypothetical protein